MTDEGLVGTPVPGRPDLLKISTEPELVVPDPHHSTRTKARKQALDILFSAELMDRDLVTVLDEWVANGEVVVREFAREIIHGVDEHMGEIDERVEQCTSPEWSMERMPRVDRNLCRIAVWELDHTATPGEAVIAEAVALATEFSTEDSPAFVNGLLAQALRTRAVSAPVEGDDPAADEDEEATEPFAEGLSFEAARAMEH